MPVYLEKTCQKKVKMLRKRNSVKKLPDFQAV